MSLFTTLSALSQTPASNAPDGAADAPSTIDDQLRLLASFVALLRDGKPSAAEVDVASAATADIGAANSRLVRITGTTTITSFGANYTGPRFVRFAGALTLTHNASTLILRGGADIVAAAGDACIVAPIGSPASGWQVVSYQPVATDPAFSAYPSATASIANGTNTKVVCDTEEFDTNACFNTTLNRFTPTVPGYYFFSAVAGYTTAGSSTDRYGRLMLYKNGSYAKAGLTVNLSVTVGTQSLTLGALIYMNGSTDYAELFVSQNSGGALTLSGGTISNYFSGHLARRA